MTLTLTLITVSTENILKSLLIKVWLDYSQTTWTLCMPIFMITKLLLKKFVEASIKSQKMVKLSIGLLPIGMLRVSSMPLRSVSASISISQSEDKTNITCSLETMKKYNILDFIKNITMGLLLGVHFAVVFLLENILKELERNLIDSMTKIVHSQSIC